MAPVSSWRLKLQRADEHLRVLDGQIKRFMEGGQTVVRELNADATEHTFRVHIAQQPAAAPGLVLGDAIGALRASLDHIVYAASIGPGRGDPQSTGFPIFVDPAEYKRRGRERVKHCSPAVRAVIEAAQPYQRGNVGRAADVRYHPLAILNGLANLDKHRVIPVLLASRSGGGWYTPSGLLAQEWGAGPLEDGAVVGRFTFGVPKTEMEVNPHFLFNVQLAPGDPAFGLPVAMALKAIRDNVGQTLAAIEPVM